MLVFLQLNLFSFAICFFFFRNKSCVQYHGGIDFFNESNQKTSKVIIAQHAIRQFVKNKFDPCHNRKD